MIRKSAFLLLLLVVSSFSMASQLSDSPSIAIEENESIIFDFANSSLAVSMLSNTVTQYDVLFYGFGWTPITIENWENTGSVTIDDGVSVILTGAILNGTSILTHDSQVSIVGSDLGEIIADERTSAYFEDSTIDYLHQGFYYPGTSVTLNNSEIIELNHQIRLGFGDNVIDQFKLYGDDISGLNISIDDSSTVHTGTVRVYGHSISVEDVTLIGIPNFDYDIDIYGGAVNVEIFNVTITEQSYLDNIANLTLASSVLDSSYHSMGVSFYHTNGTVDQLDIARGKLDLLNCDIDFLNSQLGNVSYAVSGDNWNSDFKPTFNDTTITGDFELDALVPFEHNNFEVLGKIYQKVVATGPVSTWEEVNGGVNYQSITKTLIPYENLFDIQYNFKVLPGVHFTINSSEIHTIDTVNATVVIHDSKIFAPQFGYNTTIMVYNSLVQPFVDEYGYEDYMKVGDYSQVTFYRTEFTGSGYNWNAHDTSISMDHVNFTSNLFLYKTNFTASNSYFRDLTLYSTDPCTINFVITDSILDSFYGEFVNTVYYDLYFENTTINWWTGGDTGSTAAQLHLQLVDSFVKAVWNWNWDEVIDLVVTNSILGQGSTDISLLYYKDYTMVSWVFDATVGDGLTGNYEVQRCEYSDELWSDWEMLAQVSATSYKDSSAEKGSVYAYRIVAHYVAGYLLYGLSFDPQHSYIHNIIPAKTAYSVINVNDIGNQEYYLNPEFTPIGIHVEFEALLGADETAVTHPSESLVVQYEFSKIGGEILEENNLTVHYLDLKVYDVGQYLLKARASSDQVRFWGDWLEIEVTVLDVNVNVTTEPEDSEPAPEIPGFVLLTTLMGMIIAGYMVGNKRRT